MAVSLTKDLGKLLPLLAESNEDTLNACRVVLQPQARVDDCQVVEILILHQEALLAFLASAVLQRKRELS